MGKRYEPWRNLYMNTWAKGTALIFNVHVEKIGSAPKPPFFLVCNHLSYLDILPIYLFVKCTFVAKKEVRGWPILGFLVYRVGVVFIDRKTKRDVVRVNDEILKNINIHQGIVLFPEGTSSGGENILPFRSPLLEVPAANNKNVYVATIQYRTSDKDLPASESVCYYGARHTFLEHLFLMAQNYRIDCTIHFDPVPVNYPDRKELTDALHKKAKNIFIPTNS